MKITDLTGRIHEGMWSYGFPFPDYKMIALPQPEWVETKVYCEIFEGLNSQTGTYLETPAHLLGYEKSYPLSEIPVEKLYEIPAIILNIECDRCEKRPPITRQMLEKAAECVDMSEIDSAALIISTGWGIYVLVPKDENESLLKNMIKGLRTLPVISLFVGIILGFLNIKAYLHRHRST